MHIDFLIAIDRLVVIYILSLMFFAEIKIFEYSKNSNFVFASPFAGQAEFYSFCEYDNRNMWCSVDSVNSLCGKTEVSENDCIEVKDNTTMNSEISNNKKLICEWKGSINDHNRDERR